MSEDKLIVYTGGILTKGVAEAEAAALAAASSASDAAGSADRAEDALGSGTLASLAGLASAANKLPYFSGQNVMSLTDLTSQARSLLGSTLLSRSGNNLVTGTGARITGGAVTQSASDTTSGRLLKVGDYGWGDVSTSGTSCTDIDDRTLAPGIYVVSTATAGVTPAPFGTLLIFGCPNGGNHSSATRIVQFFVASGNGAAYLRVGTNQNPYTAWAHLRTSENTTVDSNGFIKAASPIVRLFSDRIEEPVQPSGAALTRQDVGSYILTGTLGLAQDGWQIEVPRDHNGNLLCHVDTAWDGQALTVTVSEPVWDNGRWIAGDPIDVPDGRWIDIRLHEDEDEDERDAVSR